MGVMSSLGRIIRASAIVDGQPYVGDDSLWHIDNVQICATGIEYLLSTGPTTFTASMLADAVKAANDDVAIKDPRIKLGHSSNYNEELIGDAEQAFGRVEAMHLSDNGQEVIGNYVGTPEWLATVLPIAYPSRSIEGATDVETVTGKQYELVITAVSLLGVRWPGCSVIEDLPMWYGADIPEGVEFDPAEIAATGGGMKSRTMKEFQAAVDVSLIRRKFYNDGPGLENWAWWIRGERFDSVEGYNLIVDMGDGELCRFPVSVDGSDVEFGDYTLVTEEYPDKAVAASAVLAGMASVDRDMVVYASRAESPDLPTREGAQMDEATRASLASHLGLPDDATEEQINAKLAEDTLASIAAGAGEGDPAVTPPVAPAADAAEEKSDTVEVDRATLEVLQAGTALAHKHEADARATRIGDMVAAAVEVGKIPPARREHYEKLAAADFDGTKAMLDGLEANLIPVSARGNAGGDGEGISPESVQAGFPDAWFPEVGALRAAAASTSPVHQAKEG